MKTEKYVSWQCKVSSPINQSSATPEQQAAPTQPPKLYRTSPWCHVVWNNPCSNPGICSHPPAPCHDWWQLCPIKPGPGHTPISQQQPNIGVLLTHVPVESKTTSPTDLKTDTTYENNQKYTHLQWNCWSHNLIHFVPKLYLSKIYVS